MLLKAAILLEWTRLFAPYGISPWFSVCILLKNSFTLCCTLSGSVIICNHYPIEVVKHPTAHYVIQKTCYILLVVNALYYSFCVIASTASCRPYKRIWDKTIPGKCINSLILTMASAGVNVLLDVAILALPQNLIWRLQMGMKRKIGISAIFGMGVL